MYKDAELSELKGKTLSKVEVSTDQDKVYFYTTDNQTFVMYHEQDCCESVYLEDICGELKNLIGSPLEVVEEVTNCGVEGYDSYTWTFYILATAKGYVTLRWYGESNGYYSESVDFAEVIAKGE